MHCFALTSKESSNRATSQHSPVLFKWHPIKAETVSGERDERKSVLILRTRLKIISLSALDVGIASR